MGGSDGGAVPDDVAGPPRVESEIDVVHQVLDDLMDLVESARSMPMSASCVVNRAEVLGLLDDLRGRLPDALDQAQIVLGDRTAVVRDGHREAERVVAEARTQRQRMLDDTDVLRDARVQAQQVLAEARREAEGMRAEVEHYVDGKLAHFEIVLGKTLEAVVRGRSKLAGQSDLDDLDAGPDPDDGRLR